MASTIQIAVTHEDQTASLGRLLSEYLKPGFVVALDGNLGAGKTRLTQSISVGLGIPSGQVNSPTFTLSVPHSGRLELLHVDAYRIQSLNEVDELGLDEWVEDGGLLIVEWASKIMPALPPVDLSIKIESPSPSERIFRLSAHSPLGREITATLADWNPPPMI